jgi:hypothetical protein
MVRDTQIVSTTDERTNWNKHLLRVISPRNDRAASPAKPGFPFRSRFLPHRDQALASEPLEVCVLDQHDCHATASREPAANGTVAYENVRWIDINLELYSLTITTACRHDPYSCAKCLASTIPPVSFSS